MAMINDESMKKYYQQKLNKLWQVGKVDR